MMYRSPIHRPIDLRNDHWGMRNVKVLASPFERYVGVGQRTGSVVMLLTRSIHTFSMSRPISVIVLDDAGTVLRAGTVAPRRMRWFRVKRWIVEAEAGVELPAPGSQIVASTMLSRCQEH